ncbi:hypothetical protein GLOTRDRAFT_120376 [Gloeophyllum trabeum ATCC 11539]|uniref:Uncharacterized protein n=1 Tax=Gloeophyllum trabeum (strain ATCC 11539 / FP-39264 / Madison 617) TaxID=670483 RepID=S7QAT0_GLOTA|nr:uncharacterized protein GLOTRDRAFT_120376 [Gloeophyllum trabeum ATCC 11539]EPQ56986.1 hypothetical protein GLOTRDRAFT_120376 [Gloeophyllum trabeum ATCC 11539]
MSKLEFPDPFHLKDRDEIRLETLVEFRMRALAGKIIEKPNWWNKVRDPLVVRKWRKEFRQIDKVLIAKFWTPLKRGRYEPRIEDDAGDDDGDEEQVMPVTVVMGMDVPMDVDRDDADGGNMGVDEAESEDEYEYDRDHTDKIPGRRKFWPRTKVTKAQLNYIFDWLKWLADVRDVETGIEATHIPNVYQSYGLIPSELRAALLDGSRVLESVPDAEKDWHPGSNNQVLDLIHPSLHCFRIGKTLVRNPETGKLYVPSFDEYMLMREDLDLGMYRIQGQRYSLSEQHQWLPTDFIISQTGEVNNVSYINNLHPDHFKPLYGTINSVLARFLLLWERVLSDTRNPRDPVIQVDPYGWYENDPRRTPEPQQEAFKKKSPGPGENLNLNPLSAYYEAHYQWSCRRLPFIPDPPPFSPPNQNQKAHFNLKGRTIQVIVKMANIMLTPENREYAGGSWHVEGMENERIVATGIYYYESANVTESKLGFRTALCDDMYLRYEQSDWLGLAMAYGLDEYDGTLNQELGSVTTKEGKCLAFPNIWQHRVSPFKLIDPTKPGHRKILCFFLVDPTKKILSTTVVPPQQADWCMWESERAPALRNLPVELFEMVTDYLKPDAEGKGGVITMEEAKEEREKLMEERRNALITQNERVYEAEFNMCEH